MGINNALILSSINPFESEERHDSEVKLSNTGDKVQFSLTSPLPRVSSLWQKGLCEGSILGSHYCGGCHAATSPLTNWKSCVFSALQGPHIQGGTLPLFRNSLHRCVPVRLGSASGVVHTTAGQLPPTFYAVHAGQRCSLVPKPCGAAVSTQYLSLSPSTCWNRFLALLYDSKYQDDYSLLPRPNLSSVLPQAGRIPQLWCFRLMGKIPMLLPPLFTCSFSTVSITHCLLMPHTVLYGGHVHGHLILSW